MLGRPSTNCRDDSRSGILAFAISSVAVSALVVVVVVIVVPLYRGSVLGRRGVLICVRSVCFGASVVFASRGWNPIVLPSPKISKETI